MRTQPTPGHEPDDPVHLKQALLSLLVCDQPGLWSLAELDRTLALSRVARTGEQPPHCDVEDAVADLYAAGLIHRIGMYVFATRAALEAEQLATC